MKETYSILIDDNIYFVCLIERKMKNIRLKIEKNQIFVSGYKINKKKASEIINKNYDWILNKLKDFQKKNEQMFLIDIFNFKKIYIFGQIKDIIFLDNKYLIDQYEFPYKNEIDRNYELKRIRNFYSNYLIERFEYYKNIFKINSKLIIKDIKSKFGYCKYKENLICLSSRLIHLPVFVIDYVIVHEFCHFIVPNHSKKFYEEVYKYYKDYKLANKYLKEYSIICQ